MDNRIIGSGKDDACEGVGLIQKQEKTTMADDTIDVNPTPPVTVEPEPSEVLPAEELNQHVEGYSFFKFFEVGTEGAVGICFKQNGGGALKKFTFFGVTGMTIVDE